MANGSGIWRSLWSSLDTDLFLRLMVSGDDFGVGQVLLCYGSVSSPVLSGSEVTQKT